MLQWSGRHCTHRTRAAQEEIMRILTTMLATTALAVLALMGSPTPLVAATTTYTPLDCYQFGSFDEARAAYEADLLSVNPTLGYLDDDGDGLICECLYYEEICWLPSSEPPTPAVPVPSAASATDTVPPRERPLQLLDELRK
jgi:hypothetical protein